MDGYLVGIHRYINVINALIYTVYSAEFNTMSLN